MCSSRVKLHVDGSRGGKAPLVGEVRSEITHICHTQCPWERCQGVVPRGGVLKDVPIFSAAKELVLVDSEKAEESRVAQ